MVILKCGKVACAGSEWAWSVGNLKSEKVVSTFHWLHHVSLLKLSGGEWNPVRQFTGTGLGLHLVNCACKVRKQPVCRSNVGLEVNLWKLTCWLLHCVCLRSQGCGDLHHQCHYAVFLEHEWRHSSVGSCPSTRSVFPWSGMGPRGFRAFPCPGSQWHNFDDLWPFRCWWCWRFLVWLKKSHLPQGCFFMFCLGAKIPKEGCG